MQPQSHPMAKRTSQMASTGGMRRIGEGTPVGGGSAAKAPTGIGMSDGAGDATAGAVVQTETGVALHCWLGRFVCYWLQHVHWVHEMFGASFDP
jgi:hypothetical protein